jgi:hypothetical protein
MGESSRQRVRRGRAQVLAILVIALPVIIGTMGLAADVGNYFFNYVRLQTAADASVLSGAKYLPDQPCTAISSANMYASCLNGVAAAEVVSTTTSYGTKCPAPVSTPVPVTCAIPTPPVGCTMPAPPPSAEPGCNLTMRAQRTVPFYFGRLVGVTHGILNVSATATVEGARSINGIVPIGLQYTTVYSHGARTVLSFQPSPTGTIPANNWSALYLGGKSFTTVFPVGYNGSVSLYDAIGPDRGAITGPVSTAIQSRINLGDSVDPSGSPTPPSNYTANDARVVTIPLVDWGAVGGSCKVQGFAEFWVESVYNGNITGYWIADGVNGSPDPSGTAPLDGAFAITLSQ